MAFFGACSHALPPFTRAPSLGATPAPVPAPARGPTPASGASPARPEDVAGSTPKEASLPNEGAPSNTAPSETELLDAWSMAAKEDGDACRADLEAAKVVFQKLPDRKAPDKAGCGIPHPVLLIKGSTGIAYDPPIMVDCALARAMGSVERIVQEEAETHLKSRIKRIGNLGAFACRPRNFRKGSSLSAHAFGSAVDIASFHPTKGAAAIVDRDYAEPTNPNAKSTEAQAMRREFLRATFRRLRREADLTYAVGPDFNAVHHNHFHLDRGGWHFWFNR